MDVEKKGSFIPIVFDNTGWMAKEADKFHKSSGVTTSPAKPASGEGGGIFEDFFKKLENYCPI